MGARTAYRTQIEQASARFGLNPDLVEALVLVESAGHTDAFRHEPRFAARYHIAEKYPQWPVRASASSYGLMQIMATTAYEMGWRGETPEELFQPKINLRWGCHYLAACFAWAQEFKRPEADTLRAALCAYNAGRNSLTAPTNARPPNVVYSQKVLVLAGQLA